MAGHYTVINYPADSAGCGYYRMIFPKLALQTIARDIYFIESTKMIGDPTFYRDIRVVRLQRQVSNQQCQFFLKFLKPLSESLGFWLVYEIDDVIAHDDIPAYNMARDTFNRNEFFDNVKNMLEASDLITVTTIELKRYYVDKYKINEEKVLVIPNYLPRWWIGETFSVERQKRLFEENIKRPRIGIPLSSSHYDMKNQNNGVDDLSGIIDFVRSTHRKYLWNFVGHCPPPLVHLAKSGDIEISPASDMLNYPREMWRKNYQAVVVPLQDNVFNNAKSEIKFLETAALGIPCVTQRLKPYIKHNSLLFSNNNELQNVLDDLFKDKKKYAGVIKDNRHKIDYKLDDGVFSNGAWIEKNLKTWYDLYTLPQKTLKYDLRKLRGNRDGLKLELE